MRAFAFYIIVLILVFLTACSGQPAQISEDTIGQEITVTGGSYTDVSVSELKTMMEAKDFPLINVHIPFEGDLPNTDSSIPFDQIERYLDQLPADKDAKIVLYCRSGRMSSIAAETLVGLGYSEVYNLAGGFSAWQASGLPMAGQ